MHTGFLGRSWVIEGIDGVACVSYFALLAADHCQSWDCAIRRKGLDLQKTHLRLRLLSLRIFLKLSGCHFPSSLQRCTDSLSLRKDCHESVRTMVAWCRLIRRILVQSGAREQKLECLRYLGSQLLSSGKEDESGQQCDLLEQSFEPFRGKRHFDMNHASRTYFVPLVWLDCFTSSIKSPCQRSYLRLEQSWETPTVVRKSRCCLFAPFLYGHWADRCGSSWVHC